MGKLLNVTACAVVKGIWTLFPFLSRFAAQIHKFLHIFWKADFPISMIYPRGYKKFIYSWFHEFPFLFVNNQLIVYQKIDNMFLKIREIMSWTAQ